MRPRSAGVRQLFGFLTRSARVDRPSRPRSCTNCVLTWWEVCTVPLDQQMCQPCNVVAPSEVLVDIRCRAPVCSHEYPYVGFFRCPTTAFRTFTSSHSSWSEQSS